MKNVSKNGTVGFLAIYLATSKLFPYQMCFVSNEQDNFLLACQPL